MSSKLYNWTIDSLLEVTFDKPDSFLKIKETLTRIGVASKKERKLFQSCHILHKQGRYFIVHFLEMFALDGRNSTITEDDIYRRNTIAQLLEEWKLLNIVDKEKFKEAAPLTSIKIVKYTEKDDWQLVPKYSIGTKTK